MRTAALLVWAGQSTRVNIHSGSFGCCRQLERKIEMQNGVVFYFLFCTLHRRLVCRATRLRAHVNWNKHSVRRSRTIIVVVVLATADGRSWFRLFLSIVFDLLFIIITRVSEQLSGYCMYRAVSAHWNEKRNGPRTTIYY